MKAIRVHEYGGPETMKLEELPVPAPKDDEMLVRVRAMGVNPVDWKIREGHVRQRVVLPMPMTPGGDIAGVVEKFGTQASGFQVGDEVMALIGLVGAYAEYVCIKPSIAAHKPRSLDFIAAASVPLAALTAWQALTEKGGVKAGQSVLVHAAAGGVGQFAVQFARHFGATVVGTCSPPNAEFVRSLGATTALDYHTDIYTANRGRFDIVVDTQGGEVALKSLNLLKSQGILVGVAPPNDATTAAAQSAGVRAVPIMVHPDGAQLAEIGRLIDAGQVRTTVAQIFALADAGKAHDLIKTGHTRGKIVLRA